MLLTLRLMFPSVYCIFSVWLPVTRIAKIVSFSLEGGFGTWFLVTMHGRIFYYLLPCFKYARLLCLLKREIINPVGKQREKLIIYSAILGIFFNSAHMWLDTRYIALYQALHISMPTTLLVSVSLDMIGLIGQIVTYLVLAIYTSNLVSKNYSTLV